MKIASINLRQFGFNALRNHAPQRANKSAIVAAAKVALKFSAIDFGLALILAQTFAQPPRP